jgi:hypothetical protein
MTVKKMSDIFVEYFTRTSALITANLEEGVVIMTWIMDHPGRGRSKLIADSSWLIVKSPEQLKIN